MHFLKFDALTLAPFALGLLALGCDNSPMGVDAGRADSGPAASVCPTMGVPAPEELMGPCCWRRSNADRLDAPEFRLAYIELTEPANSPLTLNTVATLLNTALRRESFTWLFRFENAGADGDVTVTTGFGRRLADGTYGFSTGDAEGDPAEWCPIQVTASLTGETVVSQPLGTDLTVPVFDETGTVLQLELTLKALRITNATFSEDRSCVGQRAAGSRYMTAASFQGFIDVENARAQMININTINTSVCAAIAGPGNFDDPTYCEVTPRTDWVIKPDALCDGSGCRRNTEGMTDVCDPNTECNAWQFGADFAAAGAEISNGTCN